MIGHHSTLERGMTVETRPIARLNCWSLSDIWIYQQIRTGVNHCELVCFLLWPPSSSRCWSPCRCFFRLARSRLHFLCIPSVYSCRHLDHSVSARRVAPQCKLSHLSSTYWFTASLGFGCGMLIFRNLVRLHRMEILSWVILHPRHKPRFLHALLWYLLVSWVLFGLISWKHTVRRKH